MRAKVTTALSSLYICIYQDVFKVIDVNSRGAVKMDLNWRDVKGAFLSLGTIRQLASLTSWGKRQPVQGDQAEVRQGTETVLQEGWEFWKIKNRSRRKPMLGTEPWGTGLWLYTFQYSVSHWALQVVQPRLCQCMESSTFTWMDLSFSGWFIFDSTQTVEGWGVEWILGPPYLPLKLQLVFFNPAPSNKGRAMLASFWERKEPGYCGLGHACYWGINQSPDIAGKGWFPLHV